jgi:hypothetical protein
MNTHPHDPKLTCAALVLGLSLLLSACAPQETAAGQPSGAVSPAPSTQVSGYPGPGATMPLIPTNTAVITPPASETVQTGPITLAANPEDALPFKWRGETAMIDHRTFSRLYVQYQGQEVQLGNDSGDAQAWWASPQYLVWSFWGTAGSPTEGLYVRVVATGKDVLIVPGYHLGLAEVDGDWVIYCNWESGTSVPAVGVDRLLGTNKLVAYNVVTGQSTTLTSGIPVIRGRGETSFYSVSHNRAGWLEYDLQKRAYTMKLEDLGSGAVQTINVPLQQPIFFSLSQNVIVWRDTYWHGYSLDRNAAFTIPYAPKEWENKTGAAITVVARDSAVEWDVPLSDTAHQYYVAPVINK